MANKKNPFVHGLTVSDVLAAEASSYTIQVGSDFFSHRGRFVFSKKQAISFYNKIANNLINTLSNGDARQKKHAEKCLANLFLKSLRIN